MAVGDVYQIVIACQAGIQAGLNVRHYRVSANTGGGSVTADQWAIAIYDDVNVLYSAIMSDQASLIRVSAQKIFPGPPMMPGLSTGPAVPGLATGDLLPRQTAGLITFRTMFAGRRFRGRAYIPFPSESLNELDSSPTAAYVAGLSNLAQQMIEPVQVIQGPTTETILPVIWHRDTSTFDTITMAQVHDAWATQRRRGSFGRPNQGEAMGPPIVPIG